jgi:hypothetical protein
MKSSAVALVKEEQIDTPDKNNKNTASAGFADPWLSVFCAEILSLCTVSEQLGEDSLQKLDSFVPSAFRAAHRIFTTL